MFSWNLICCSPVRSTWQRYRQTNKQTKEAITPLIKQYTSKNPNMHGIVGKSAIYASVSRVNDIASFVCLFVCLYLCHVDLTGEQQIKFHENIQHILTCAYLCNKHHKYKWIFSCNQQNNWNDNKKTQKKAHKKIRRSNLLLLNLIFLIYD
jgi:hypothetical protein